MSSPADNKVDRLRLCLDSGFSETKLVCRPKLVSKETTRVQNLITALKPCFCRIPTTFYSLKDHQENTIKTMIQPSLRECHAICCLQRKRNMKELTVMTTPPPCFCPKVRPRGLSTSTSIVLAAAVLAWISSLLGPFNPLI